MGDPVGPYVSPILWLTAGALALAFQVYAGSSRIRARQSSDRLAEVQKARSAPLRAVLTLLAGLFCSYGALRNLIGGSGTWWLWSLAAAAQFATVALGRGASVRQGAGEGPPRAKLQRRHRRALAIALPAAACLYAAQPVLESAARRDNALIGAAGVFLGTAALLGFVAAGWSAVWVSGDREPDQEPASRQDTLSDASGPMDGGGTARS